MRHFAAQLRHHRFCHAVQIHPVAGELGAADGGIAVVIVAGHGHVLRHPVAVALEGLHQIVRHHIAVADKGGGATADPDWMNITMPQTKDPFQKGFLGADDMGPYVVYYM